jgi:undecaprenyl-diphosphatase
MSFWILIVLAIVQGLTEFLPVSSSGHLVLLYNVFGVEDGTILLSIVLHIATLLSVLIYYRKEVLTLIRHPLCPTNRKIIVTTIFTCGIVLIIKPIIDRAFGGEYLFIFFIITAILLFVSDYMAERNGLLTRTANFVQKDISRIGGDDITNIGVNYKQAILIGITQGFACIPGISRSGSTIAIGRISGAEDSARYSFLISIPIIIASFVMELIGSDIAWTGVNVVGLIVSMIVCFIIGLVCIKFMTKLVSSNKLTIFSYYLIALSTILIVLSFIN